MLHAEHRERPVALRLAPRVPQLPEAVSGQRERVGDAGTDEDSRRGGVV